MDAMNVLWSAADSPLAVVPVLVGPLQALMAILPGILVALGGLIVTMFKPTTMKRIALLLWAQKLIVLPAVAAIVLVGWGLVHAADALFPSVASDLSVAAAGDWPLWRGDPSRRAHVGGAEDPTQGKINWTFTDGKTKTFYASPAVAGNRLYVTSARYEYFKDEGGIYCLDLDGDSAKLAWSFKGDGYRSTFSSPSIYEDKQKGRKYLVVGEGLHLTDNARVFCLDVTESERRQDGVKLWSFRTNSHVESSPCVANGKVFIGAGDDGFYCFALEGDGQGGAKMLWHLPGTKSKDAKPGATVYPDCETSPVYYKPEGASKGFVFFGLGIGGQAVVCVDEDGAEQWRIETPYPVFGSPSIADGKMYVGMGHGDFVNTAEQVQANLRKKLEEQGKTPEEIEAEASKIFPVGEVWCIDVATHAVDWKVKAGRVILGAVAVDGDFIYFGSRDGHLYRVTTDGKQVRKWNAHAPIITSCSVGKDHVYVVTTSGDLYGLDKQTMEMVWNVSLNSEVFSSPVTARGHIYVGTTTNGLMCIGQPGGAQKTEGWAGALGGPGASGWIDGSLGAARGTYAWGYAGPAAADGQTPSVPTITAPAAVLGNALFVGLTRDGKHGLAKVQCGEDLADGAAVKESWFVECGNPVTLSAVATPSAVLFVDGDRGRADRMLRCVDPTNGGVLWQRPVAAEASGSMVLGDSGLLIADTADALTCLDISAAGGPAVRWQAKIGQCVGMALPMDGLVIAATANPARCVVLDEVDGSAIMERPLPSAPTTGPVYAAGRIWIGQSGGLVGVSLLVGERDVTVACGDPMGALAANGDRLAFKAADGAIVVVDAANAKEVLRLTDAVGSVPPVLTDDVLLYVADGSIRHYDLKLGENTQWAVIRSSFPGLLTSPMVVADSHVFFATDKKGLVCMKPRKR